MTDKEVIKALECCVDWRGNVSCWDCPLKNTGCIHFDKLKETLDLINRLQAKLDEAEDTIQFAYKKLKKAEAEVETELDKLNAEKNDVMYHKAQIKAESIKEFAERLKENSIATFSWNGVVLVEEIDNLVKEMVDDNDE